MTNIVAEIGINHNGSVEMAKRLIDVAKFAGCDYVKFQKRTPSACVPERARDSIRKTPWGDLSYLEYRERLEFGKKEYDEIVGHCIRVGIGFFFSVWDEQSAEFAAGYSGMMKIPSARLTDAGLLKFVRNKSSTLILSTGMSDETEVEKAVSECDPEIIFHTNSSYPSPVAELNLNYIKWLKKKHPGRSIGYSGHEFGLTTTFAAVALGAEWVERHVTLDRTMWGSDQESSVEPVGLIKLVKGIRDLELSLGRYGPREVTPSENKKKETLRK